MAPFFGFTDELRVVFLNRGASWGALALYRGEEEPPFTATDAGQLGAVSEQVAEGIQRSLFRLDPGAVPSTFAVTEGAAVLIIDAAESVTHLTPAAPAAIDELGGRDHGSLPDTVLAVVVTTRTRAEHTDTQTRGLSGRWLSLRAAPLTGPSDRSDVVVTFEPTPRAALSRLALAAHGLTSREEEVALLVLQGADTRTIAGTLHLSRGAGPPRDDLHQARCHQPPRDDRPTRPRLTVRMGGEHGSQCRRADARPWPPTQLSPAGGWVNAAA